ncbi:hypothetical protein TRVL_00520 [Trypanosoma vivax]|nr:hypothetical protein TRVL_00520 [Trypanosoma vivax]
MIYSNFHPEVSYSSTLLTLWAVALAIMSCSAGNTIQGVTVLLLISVALSVPHGESRILFPLLFLSERLLGDVMSRNIPWLDFYASTVLSLLTLVTSHILNSTAANFQISLRVVVEMLVLLITVFLIFMDSAISVGSAIFVTTGFFFFLGLRALLGESEAVLVASIAGLHAGGEAVHRTDHSSLHVQQGSPEQGSSFSLAKAHIVSRFGILCAIWLTIALYYASRFCFVVRFDNSKSCGRIIHVQRITCTFWLLFVATFAAGYMIASDEIKEDIFVWLWNYIFSSNFRVITLICWLTLLPLTVLCVDLYTKWLSSIVRRKLFHFIAVMAFSPAALNDPEFLSFALSVATALTTIVELARYYKVSGSTTLNSFLVQHIDGRDRIDGVVRTHIYLMYGLGLSMILYYRHEHQESKTQPSKTPLVNVAINIIPGIIGLGVADSCAAIVGSSFLLSYRRTLGRYLSNRLYTERANASITHKTTTGTLAGLIFGALFWLLVLLVSDVPDRQNTLPSFFLIPICSLTECFMDGVDNLQLPLVVYGAINSVFALLLRDAGQTK